MIFKVCANSLNHNISAFQFGLNSDNLIITEVSLGQDALTANMLNYDDSNLSVLAFSYSSNFIPIGNNLELALFKGNYTNNEGLVRIIPNSSQNGSLTIASSNGEELSVLINNSNWQDIPEN